MSSGKSSRRKFLKDAAVTGAAFTIVPRYVLGGPGYTAPSDTLNIAGIGVGGQGRGNLQRMASENIVALADVDWNRAKDTFKDYPKAERFKDYRKMLNEVKDIDAVMIATPDHIHAGAGLMAMGMDKHVYIEKPLAHNIAEVRALTEMALSKPNLVTQMGNQGASGEGIRQTQEIYEAGLLGDVHTVYAWTNRPIWPQGGQTPSEKQEIPKTLDWNLWLGPAEWREYNAAYLPFAWRGFWDFGTGALG
ncbi:MAG: Gfo/Idh/MocA family oxidoreductase, partial [Bacteroidota bacterium]